MTLPTLPSNRQPPSRWHTLNEARAVVDFGLGLLINNRRLPRGNGQPVMVIPGFGASDRHTFLLRRRLSALGYDVRGWGLGTNHGKVGKLLPALTAGIREQAIALGQPIHLVGWSLGGYLAREVARDAPDIVAQVVTLGSPLVGGPTYTVFARGYRKQGVDLDKIAAAMQARDVTPIRCPITSIYARRDGIVAWHASIDTLHKQAVHMETRATHFGLLFHPQTLGLIAQALAASKP